jgi:hypothetical protein
MTTAAAGAVKDKQTKKSLDVGIGVDLDAAALVPLRTISANTIPKPFQHHPISFQHHFNTILTPF